MNPSDMVRLGDLLEFRANGRPPGPLIENGDPTPEQIAERCREVRQTWDARREQAALGSGNNPSVDIPFYDLPEVL